MASKLFFSTVVALLFLLIGAELYKDNQKHELWGCFAQENNEVKIVAVTSAAVTGQRYATTDSQIIVEVEGLSTHQHIILRERNDSIQFKSLPQVGEIWRIRMDGRWLQLERK